MSHQDEVPVALRPRARILRTLGEELISSETVAVIELVKNAYDADASFAEVSFTGAPILGSGTIEVRDDGHGMDLPTVQRAWMEPATDFKKKARLSPGKSRRLLGEKGVGRFASARLAAELELATRRPDSDEEVYAYFDWTQFDREDLYLDEIMILAERRLPTWVTPECYPESFADTAVHGTILRMSHLKKNWDAQAFEDLRRGLSRLISPFDGDQSFRISLRLPDDVDGTSSIVGPPEILKYPHYSISGKVEEDGAFAMTLDLLVTGECIEDRGYLGRIQEIGRSVLVETDGAARADAPPRCGPIEFRVLIWDRDQLDSVQQKLGVGLRSVRQDLNAVSGISIYRDGFRVLPYGEPDNDWLRLDMRRVQNPSLRLSNNQLTGFIRLGADTNPELRDQSNREGLDSNDAFLDLQQIMLFALSKVETSRYRVRRGDARKATGEGADSLLSSPDTSALRGKLADKLSEEDEAMELFDATTRAWEQQVSGLREVLTRYHSLATIGQLVDKVVHDTRQPLSKIVGQSGFAADIVAGLLSQIDEYEEADAKKVADLAVRIGRIETAAGIIDAVIRRIEPLGGRKRGRPKSLYLEEIIKSVFNLFDGDLSEAGVAVTLPDSQTLVTVEAAELQEVIINLLTNSLHWLKAVARDRRKILVSVSRRSPQGVEIVFADSGPGISQQDRKAIFDPYFSTRPNGVGLGLVLAGEIVRDFYNGSLELLDSQLLSGAVFRIVLNRRVAE